MTLSELVRKERGENWKMDWQDVGISCKTCDIEMAAMFHRASLYFSKSFIKDAESNLLHLR
jgi:hypothetical protein